MQNAIKLENISSLITSPSRTTVKIIRLVHLLFMAGTHQWNVCVRKFLKQMKKKYTELHNYILFVCE